jgi:hypothetical protein
MHKTPHFIRDTRLCPHSVTVVPQNDDYHGAAIDITRSMVSIVEDCVKLIIALLRSGLTVTPLRHSSKTVPVLVWNQRP